MSQTASSSRVTGFEWSNQDNLLHFTRGCETFTKNLFNVAAQQIELTRDLIEGSLADYSLLANARTPEAMLHAEVELFRRGSERAFGAATKITDAMQQVFTDAISAAAPSARKATTAY